MQQGQYGMQPGSMTAMANGPPSGGMMRPPGAPLGGPPGMPGAGGPPGYGAQQAAAGMQQMSLGGPPGPPAGMSGPPPPPAGLGAGPGSGGPRPPGSFGAAPRPMPMGPPSGGVPGGPPGGAFPRGPVSGGPPPGPSPPGSVPGGVGAPMPGSVRPPAAGMPGGPRPMGAPIANGNGPPAMPQQQPQQQQPGMQQPLHTMQQQPQQPPAMQQPGGMMGPAGMRPPGAPMGAPMVGGVPPGPGPAAAGGGAMNVPPGSSAGPMPGGARPAMPGFMPAGPPGGPRPMGPGPMGGPVPGPAAGGPPMPGAPPGGGFVAGGAPPGGGMMGQQAAAGGPQPGGMMGGPPGGGMGMMGGMPGGGPPPMGGAGGMMRPPGPPGGFGPPGAGMAGPPPPGMPGAVGGPPSRQAMTSGRIDPTQIPRVVQPTQEVQVFETRVNGAHVHPPSSLSRFIVRDRGNASPRLMRSTLNAVPMSADMLNNSGMQFALSVQPLGLPDPEDDPVVVVDLGELGPVRCGRCKAYMNPYMRWTDGGKTFVCNFCGQGNPCPDVYFNYLGPDNRRRDVYERAELSCGTYEIVATKAYMVRDPQPVIHVFCIDVSQPAIASGATAATCSCIEQILDSLQGGDNTLVGIVTYDSAVHFYNVSKGQAVAQMLVMADVSDVYAPMSSNLLAKLSEARDQLAELLSSIPSMFAAGQGPECCAAAAVEACIELLKPTGGKLHAFITGLPNAGSRALKMRDGNATLAEKEKQMYLLPQDNTYLTLAAQAADFNVCIDLFVMSQAYVDIATLSTLSHTTCGSLYTYCPFNPLMDQDQLLNDLKWNVSRPQGLEAILRVRCSQGLDVDSYLGSFYKPPNSPTDLYLPAIDCDKALIARLEIMEKLPANSEVYLQCALLYTTTDGARRVRVSTLALPVSDQMGAVFKGADLDSQLAALTRQVAVNLPGGTFFSSKETILGRITAILAAYRKYCATSSSAVQLILPEALKLLPLYSLALHKSNMLRPDVKADDRSAWLAGIVGASPPRMMGLLHPRLYAVHNLLRAGCMPPNGQLPESLVLSSEMVDSGGVYLLDSGADLLLYVDQEAPDQIVQDLFALPNVDALLRAQQPLPLVLHDNPGSKLLFELLTALRQNRCAFMRLRIAKKGDPFYPVFANMLVEDRSTAGMSYVEFLCHVHRQIQEKMS